MAADAPSLPILVSNALGEDEMALLTAVQSATSDDDALNLARELIASALRDNP